MSREAMKLAKAWFERNTYGDEAVDVYEALCAALAEQSAQQEPVAIPDCGEAGHDDGACGNRECLPSFRRSTTSPPAQRKPQFKEFIKWAGAQGYDCAQTCNSDTGEWICLNPMTADLWKAWQAAHGIKENNT